jgi:predicted glycosyltransferase
VSEERLKQAKPDYVLILPWNLKAELSDQLAYVSNWGGRLVTAIPYLEIA